MSQFIDWSKFREGKLRVIVRTKEEAIDFINEYLKNTNINNDFTYEEYFETLFPEEEPFTKEDTLGVVFGAYEDCGWWYYTRLTKKNREKYIEDIDNTIFWCPNHHIQEDIKIEKEEAKEIMLNFQEVLQRVSKDGELYLEIRHPLINKQEVYYSGTFDTILFLISLTFDSSDIVDILLNSEWIVIEDN